MFVVVFSGLFASPAVFVETYWIYQSCLGTCFHPSFMFSPHLTQLCFPPTEPKSWSHFYVYPNLVNFSKHPSFICWFMVWILLNSTVFAFDNFSTSIMIPSSKTNNKILQPGLAWWDGYKRLVKVFNKMFPQTRQGLRVKCAWEGWRRWTNPLWCHPFGQV